MDETNVYMDNQSIGSDRLAPGAKATGPRPEGFRGQSANFAPLTIRQALKCDPLTTEISVLDVGWFPRARDHFRDRPAGADETILICCTAGSGWFEVGGSGGTLQAGQFLLIPAKVPHRYGADSETPWSIHWTHWCGTAAGLYLRKIGPPERALSVSEQLLPSVKRVFADCHKMLNRDQS